MELSYFINKWCFNATKNQAQIWFFRNSNFSITMIYCVPKLSKLSFGFLIELKVCYCWESKFSIHNFELHTRIISDIIWVCLLLNYQKIPILTSLDLPLTFLRFYEKGFSMVGPNFYILRLFLSGYLHNNMIQYQTDM